MTSPAAAAAEDRPRRKLYTQLWFWVLIAIAAGIVFGLVAPEHRREGEVARGRVHPAHPGDHRPGDLRHRRDRHRVDRQPRRAGGLAAARARLLLRDDGHRARARPDRRQHRRARQRLRAAQPDDAARASAEEEIGEAGGDAGASSRFITDNLLPELVRASRSWRTRSCASWCSASSPRRRSRSSPTRERKRVVAVFEVRRPDHLRRHPARSCGSAPLGAFGGMAYTVAVFGSASLANLGLLMVTFWGTCAFFVFVILGLVARLSGFSIFRFIRHDPRRAADHRRHVVVGDRAAAAAGQARGGGRVAPDRSAW